MVDGLYSDSFLFGDSDVKGTDASLLSVCHDFSIVRICRSTERRKRRVYFDVKGTRG